MDSSNVDCIYLNTFTNLKILPENDISWLKFFHSTYDCVSDMIAYILQHAWVVEYMEIVLTVMYLRPILNIGSFLIESVEPIVILGTNTEGIH